MEPLHVVVVGGGAAGFFGAIACAETHPHASVTLLEKGAHVLTKVRISGGGRCNVTHACYDPKLLIKNYPRGGPALLGPFHSFQPKDTVAWFESRGVTLKTEEDGRIFPTTDMSLTIINALKGAASKAGVRLKTYAGPMSIVSQGSRRFVITFNTGETIKADRVLLATGSAPDGYTFATSLGHTLSPPVPSLFTFTIPDGRLRALAGISVPDAQVKLRDTSLQQSGPLLITHWGLSGPAILKLSAWGARVLHEKYYRASLEVNWIGNPSAETHQELMTIKAAQQKKFVASNPPFELPQRLWKYLIGKAGVPESHRWADLSHLQMKKITEAVTASVYKIMGKSTFKEEFVTCGGVRLDEVNFKTMESRKTPGLYLAGEILDIDGLTGGFNFQSAWTTAWLAGQAVGKI